MWGKKGSGVRGFHPRAHLGLGRDEEAGWRKHAAAALGSLVAALGEQRRAMAAVVACGGERAPRWGPFIAQLGRWGGGGRWPASRGPRRPLMAPGRSCVSRSGARVVRRCRGDGTRAAAASTGRCCAAQGGGAGGEAAASTGRCCSGAPQRRAARGVARHARGHGERRGYGPACDAGTRCACASQLGATCACARAGARLAGAGCCGARERGW